MTDRHIEDKLRDCWDPKPPDEMWERTVMRARRESAERLANRRVFGVGRWKLALATLGVAIIAFTNIAENVREERMAAMAGNASSSAIRNRMRNIAREYRIALAPLPEESRPQPGSKGEDSL